MTTKKKGRKRVLPEVRDYLAMIGAKGGEVQKGTKQRKELNSRAAEIRWRKHHPKPPEMEEAEAAENI